MLYVGRLQPIKDPVTLLKALETAKQHLPELTAGLKQLTPCWEKIRIQPEFIFDEVRFKLPLPQGILKYSVKGTEDNFRRTWSTSCGDLWHCYFLCPVLSES